MPKILLAILALTLLMGIVACYNEEKVKKELEAFEDRADITERNLASIRKKHRTFVTTATVPGSQVYLVQESRRLSIINRSIIGAFTLGLKNNLKKIAFIISKQRQRPEKRRQQVVINQSNQPPPEPSTSLAYCCFVCGSPSYDNHIHYDNDDNDGCNCYDDEDCDGCDDGCTGCFD